MQTIFTLEENDFLTFQLFAASKSQRIKRKRLWGWIITTITFLVLSYLFADKTFLRNYFLVLSVLSAFFYPIYNRWRYKRHFQRYVKEVYKNRGDGSVKFTIIDDYIETVQGDNESKIKLSELSEINEINDYFFLFLKNGQGLVVPKYKIGNVGQLTSAIKDIVHRFQINYFEDLNWKWR